jgi:hypothetical protein
MAKEMKIKVKSERGEEVVERRRICREEGGSVEKGWCLRGLRVDGKAPCVVWERLVVRLSPKWKVRRKMRL